MPESLLQRAARVAGRVAPYAAVPAALTLLAFDNVAAAATSGGAGVSVKFALPTAVATLWTVFDPPSTGLSFVSPTPLSALPVFLVVDAVLTAGYLGAIRDASHGVSPDFGRNVAAYALPVLGVRFVEFLTLGLFSFLLVSSGSLALGVVAAPLLLVAGYLIWAAPFLVVTHDFGAVDALAASVSLASAGGRYLQFSVVYAVGAAVASALVSPLLTAGGFGTVVALTALVAYPSLVASAAAMLVVRETAGSSSATRQNA